MPRATKDVQKSLEGLSISSEGQQTTNQKAKATAKRPKDIVVESWDEDSLSSGDDTETEVSRPTTAGGSTAEMPGAPPPTPVSPRAPRGPRIEGGGGGGSGGGGDDDDYMLPTAGNWPPYDPSSSSSSSSRNHSNGPGRTTSTSSSSATAAASVSAATASGAGSGSGSQPEAGRPEKTDAVARRMIAGALGVRAPKKTDEQREYERAVRDKEMRRRNREREMLEANKREAERAKAAVWED